MKRLMVVLILAASSAPAQVCVGDASFASGPIHLGATAGFGEGFTSYGGSVGAGAPRGPWLVGNVGFQQHDNADNDSFSFGATLGQSRPMGSSNRIEMCPVLSFTSFSGPHLETMFGTVKITGHSVGMGASLGATAATGETLEFVPYIGVTVASIRTYADLGAQRDVEDDNFGVFAFGAGLVVRKAFSIQPYVNIPLGLEGGDMAYGVSATIKLGWRRRQAEGTLEHRAPGTPR